MIPISDSDHKVRRFPFINILLIVANLFVFFQQLTTPDPEGFIYKYALVPSQVNFADYNTLIPFVTSMFLHGGFLHIISNMLFLWVFGDNVEDVFGSFVYLFVYLLSGIIGGLAQYMISPTSDIPMLGASGAVAGALGAYFVLFPRHRIRTIIPPFYFFSFHISAGIMLGYWIILQIISGSGVLSVGAGEGGGVAYLAHIGGFAAGFLYAKVLPKRYEALEPAHR